MTPSPNALRLGTVAAIVAASGGQAQQSCPMENRVYTLTPTDERVSLSRAGELREDMFLRLDPVIRQLQACASREDIQSSSAIIEYQDGSDLRSYQGIFGVSYQEGEPPKNCCEK